MEEKDVVLTGKCRPQETVNYRALDPVIDELTRYMARLPPQEMLPLMPRPRYATALLGLFPVLGTISAFANTESATPAEGAAEIRQMAYLGLRDILVRLSDTQRIFIWIDDAQWGDRDSVDVFKELFTGADAPGVTVILSYPAHRLQSWSGAICSHR